MRTRSRALGAAACAAMLLAPAAAGAQMLHDAQLEKATADLLAAHKAADVPGAMQKTLDQQAALDREELAGLRKADAANHERALSELLSSDPQFLGTKRLNDLIDSRVQWLAPGATFDPRVWEARREKVVLVDVVTDALRHNLAAAVRDYEQNGGHDFTDCAAFETHRGDDPSSRAMTILRQCDLIQKSEVPKPGLDNAVTALEAAGGEFTAVTRQLNEAKRKVGEQETARKAAKVELDAAKQALEDAKAAPDAQARVEEKLKALDDLLARLDGQAGLVGDRALVPGQALALIEFRKTNLRDVVAATGSTADTEAAKINRSIVGVIAGIIKFNEAGRTPSQAALSIALAHQTGLEGAIAVQLESLKTEVTLLQEQREALLREIEYLALARSSLAAIPANTTCGRLSMARVALADLVRSDACPRVVRQTAARALSAYSMSWASGRTPAVVADARITQEIYWRKLRVTNQVVRARYEVQQVAMQELAAAGAAGVKPSEIAEFLSAIGVTAIAIGVN